MLIGLEHMECMEKMRTRNQVEEIDKGSSEDHLSQA
jgi:hypothetical protein